MLSFVANHEPQQGQIVKADFSFFSTQDQPMFFAEQKP
jgi:hypothetical protein